ncbi:unnamed protein product [Cylindrotheca closterium]|uniref:Photolyase/cryptochrome alpha/beta domain-containing protein n=1 Tax=Cylindrotheca closterium TaxID=2856 RepID=A0AAD2FIP4_9STRA|nr:unnamed protein product [Cylindrotheca closterium]
MTNNKEIVVVLGEAPPPKPQPPSATASAESNSRRRRRRRLIWHRRDLRLHDNELYAIYNELNSINSSPNHNKGDDAEGCDHNESLSFECISLFIFDPKYFHPQPSLACPKEYDTIWCGPHATQATIEAVHGLRQKLRSIGGELLVRTGDPTSLVPQLADEIKADEIVFGEEPGTYERAVAQQLQQHHYWNQNPWGSYDDSPPSSSLELKSVIGYTLFHPNDLPTDPDQWSKLAHPKQQTSKKKQKNKKKAVQQTRPSNPTTAFGNRVDVSPERFKGICRIMGDFRKAARSSAKVRPLYQTPTKLNIPSTAANMESGTIPTLNELMAPALKSERPIMGMERDLLVAVVDRITLDRESQREAIADKDSSRQVDNGPPAGHSSRPKRTEDAALQRLDDFISSGRAAVADRSRADVATNDHSSRFSVHLALGTLSPRAIYWRVVQQNDDEEHASCQWLASHLEMRDFFLYTAFANDKYLFSTKGIPRSNKRKQPPNSKNRKNQKNSKNVILKEDVGDANESSQIIWKSPAVYKSTWIRWATGNTHFPLIDAAMRELMTTGYCSNRVRQNVASFLTKDLQMDWRAGAEWFQFWLEDHCVGANYGNWLYFSGVGPDPKNRHFRSLSQMKKYDRHYNDAPSGSYVQKWVPELLCDGSSDNPETLFRPWDFNVPGFEDPIVDPTSQYIWQDAQRLAETGNLLE